jgi:hypothetical protein
MPATERASAPRPAGVYDPIGGDAHGRGTAGFDEEPSLSGASRENGGFERDHGAMRLGVAAQRQHKGVGVDDAGGGR